MWKHEKTGNFGFFPWPNQTLSIVAGCNVNINQVDAWIKLEIKYTCENIYLKNCLFEVN